MNIRDTIGIAYRTIRANKVRTGITVAIIAFGIMALVGIRTAITAMQQKFLESFSSMGATGFTIRFREPRNPFGPGRQVQKEEKGQRRERRSNTGKPITRQEAQAFRDRFDFPATVSISLSGPRNAVVSFGNARTTPTVRVDGGDEHYTRLNGFEVVQGRDFSLFDVRSGRNLCLIGSEVARNLFGDYPERALGKIIRVNQIPFQVAGVLGEKGASLGFSWDNMVVISYRSVERYFMNNPNASYSVLVQVPDIRLLEAGIGEATAEFRRVRRLSTTEAENFVIEKSDNIVALLLGQLSNLTGAALVIGFITLTGAAIGLMNIMLVAVSERTREVGLIKAIGGKQAAVRRQFLFESVMISLIGALFGVVLGVIVGNGFAIFLDTGFVLPWAWMGLGILICSGVGLLAGVYPAIKAARLNPIQALRYE